MPQDVVALAKDHARASVPGGLTGACFAALRAQGAPNPTARWKCT